MNYISSTFQDYQPIFVGAGCLAMGYMIGRRCRSMNENSIGVPMTSDGACCIQSESNCVLNNVVVDRDTIEFMCPTKCPTNSHLNISNPKMEKFGKRDLNQIEIVDDDMLKTTKKEEDTLWAKTCASKKQKGIPMKESIETKPRLDEFSDDEILAQRLEYFSKNASYRRSSISKPRTRSNLSILSKKKKSILDGTTNCTKVRRGKEIRMDSQNNLSKETTRSFSCFDALATRLYDQGECSLEDTCRSPKTICLDHKDPSSKDLVEMQYKIKELDKNLNNIVVNNEEEARLDAKMGNIANKDDIVLYENGENILDLSTNPLPKPHVQDRCLIEKQEVKEEHAIPIDKVLKVEIYELLHIADCAKVSFEHIVTSLEEKLKVVLQEDKAHIVSLIREVINISKLLEEENGLEGFEQV